MKPWDFRVDGVHSISADPGSYSHGGWGGSFLWVDPVQEMVLVFLSTQHDVWIPARFPAWEADLFVNAATSAVADE